MNHTRRQIYEVLEAKSLRKRDWQARLADHLTTAVSRPAFLFLNAGVFVLWIGTNIGVVPGVLPFDPYPFGLLTMVVSLEAIILSIFVLISQNRAAQIATLREELHLQINQIAEQEVTKCLELLTRLLTHTGIEVKDPELERMLEKIDPMKLEDMIEKQLLRADQSLVRQFIGNTLHRPHGAKNS